MRRWLSRCWAYSRHSINTSDHFCCFSYQLWAQCPRCACPTQRWCELTRTCELVNHLGVAYTLPLSLPAGSCLCWPCANHTGLLAFLCLCYALSCLGVFTPGVLSLGQTPPSHLEVRMLFTIASFSTCYLTFQTSLPFKRSFLWSPM